MKLLLVIAAIVLSAAAVLVVAHLALIEIGREIVILRTPAAGGGWKETRLWIVDAEGVSWLHSAGAEWAGRFEGDSTVEVERGGQILRYRATPVPGPHLEIDRLLREKYGLADRWVRFLAPCGEGVLPVRLEPVTEETPQ